VPSELFTTNVGGRPIVDGHAVVNCFRDGASFGITGADSRWPPLRRIVECFHDALLESVHTNVYCSPADTQGFQCHYDLHEVFVLQVEGTKHWRVFRPLTEAPVEGWTPEAAQEVLQTEPYVDVVLQRGDVLYVPRGHWHYAIAEHSLSLHVTVGITCRKGLAFLDWLQGELADDPAWRRNAPLLMRGDGAQWSAALKASLAEKLADPTLFERFQRDSVRDVHPLHTIDLLRQGLPDSTALDHLVFERPPGRPFVVDAESGEAVVTVAGTDIQLARINPIALQRIFASPSFTLADVKSWDPEADPAEVADLLSELVRSGLLLTRSFLEDTGFSTR
jgi:hypothetical protein